MENGTRVPQFVVGNLRAGSYKFIGNKTKIFRNSTGPIYHQLHLFAKSKITWPGGSSNAPLVSLCVVLQERNVMRIAKVTRVF